MLIIIISEYATTKKVKQQFKKHRILCQWTELKNKNNPKHEPLTTAKYYLRNNNQFNRPAL